MTVFQSIFLGILQGFTEFLPVSSSGHLVLAKSLMGLSWNPETGAAMEIFLHFGTMMSVVVAFRKDLLNMAASVLKACKNYQAMTEHYTEDVWFRTVLMILIATVPAGVAGVLLGDKIEQTFGSPLVTSLGLLITGGILLTTRFFGKFDRPVTVPTALWIGVAQAVALFPGISRSGSTVSMALFRGVSKDVAARFSFILSIPAILGASLLKAADLLQVVNLQDLLLYLLGAGVAFACGLLAISGVLLSLRKKKFHYFGVYCLIVGAVSIALQMLK